MDRSESRGFRESWQTLRNVFSFFFSLGRQSKKTKVFYLISLMPLIMVVVIKIIQTFHEHISVEGIYVFSNIIMAFYLQFLILILALFFGTSVCSEELEGKTLTYLTTRPISKTSIILGKYAAYTVLIILMTVVGVILSFVVLNLNDLLNLSYYRILFKYIAVLCLGIMCYTAFFTFMGTFLKKSILFGLVFTFGWENVIQYFPGSTQRFTIVHYLKSLLPSPVTSRFSFLLFRLEPTSPVMAVFILFLVTSVFLALACLLFSWKEYILED